MVDTTRFIQVASLGFVGFLVPPAVELFGRGRPAYAIALGLAGLLAFAALFGRLLWTGVVEPHHGRGRRELGGLAVLGLALQPLFGLGWLLTASFIVTSVALLSEPRRRWAPWFGGVVAADVLIGLALLDLGPGRTALVAGVVVVYGLFVGGFYWVAGLSAQLSTARAELARAAVAAERLRIARDLHDVLGQRLTEVVLKAELAARMVEVEPSGAADEMRAVGRIAREVLGEVRTTVSGYRDVTLDSEVATAREVARAGGVDLDVELPAPPPNGATATTLAWVVREGVTNVMRHARAHRCVVTVTAGDPVVVTVVDDGPAAAGGRRREIRFGTGLTGLAERVSAAGGTLRADADAERFTLRAELPAVAR